MTSSGSSLFASVIEEHLALKRRNAKLDADLPLDEFEVADPFTNHPLFKSEDDARREEEQTGEHPALAREAPQETAELPAVAEDAADGSVHGWMETTASQEFTWD
jgi:hypothetical protein